MRDLHTAHKLRVWYICQHLGHSLVDLECSRYTEHLGYIVRFYAKLCNLRFGGQVLRCRWQNCGRYALVEFGFKQLPVVLDGGKTVKLLGNPEVDSSLHCREIRLQKCGSRTCKKIGAATHSARDAHQIPERPAVK